MSAFQQHTFKPSEEEERVRNPTYIVITAMPCLFLAGLNNHIHAYHVQLGREIAEAGVDLLVATGRFAAVTCEAAKKYGKNNLSVYCLEKTEGICDNLREFIKNGDVVLIKGSRVMRLEKVTEKLKEIFGIARKDTRGIN